MKTLKKDLVLNAPRDEDYHLDLVLDKYQYGGNIYLGLIDKKNKEFFSDITVNDTNILLEKGWHLIADDFINCCFKCDNWKAFGWLADALDLDIRKDFKIVGNYRAFRF